MKTAKEILKEVKDKNQGELSFIYWPNTAIEAMESFAAQSVREYKEKLKKEVTKRIDDHHSIGSMEVLTEKELFDLIESTH